MKTFSPPSAKFCSAPPPVPEGGTEQMTSTGARYGKVCPETIWISGGTCPMVRVATSVSLHIWIAILPPDFNVQLG